MKGMTFALEKVGYRNPHMIIIKVGAKKRKEKGHELILCSITSGDKLMKLTKKWLEKNEDLMESHEVKIRPSAFILDSNEVVVTPKNIPKCVCEEWQTETLQTIIGGIFPEFRVIRISCIS